jgi:hypothetical protein
VSFRLQRIGTVAAEGRYPLGDGTWSHTHLPSHFGLTVSSFQQRHGSQPTLLRVLA